MSVWEMVVRTLEDERSESSFGSNPPGPILRRTDLRSAWSLRIRVQSTAHTIVAQISGRLSRLIVARNPYIRSGGSAWHDRWLDVSGL